MGDRTEAAAIVALLRLTARPWSEITNDVETASSAVALLERELKPAQGELFSHSPTVDAALADAQQDVAAWTAEGMQITTVVDAEYPVQLLTVHQRPPFIMYRGELRAADATGVAIVGTPKASPPGLRQAADLAEGLAEQGVAVVSGLAAGIDTAALSAALRVGGRAVAVIGTGLRRAYPKENAALQATIAEQGAVISQFWPDAPPTRTSFPMRNAVMSGYAAATVVVEAPWKSGARMQARLALEHGRRVFLLSSLLEHDWARDYARRPGAVVVSGPEDVLESLPSVTSVPDQLTWA